jgi:hypothetical protein
MTSVFDTDGLYQGGRHDPIVPLPLIPLAATDGADDADSDDGSPSPGLGLDFFIKLGASIGSLTDAIQADRADRTSRMEAPGNAQLSASGVVPSSGLLILDLGSVPQGRVWGVRRIVTGGAKVTTTAAGEAYIFSQGAPPVDLNISNCVDIYLTLPRGSTYGTHELFLTRGEHLWVAFAGATSGQQYGASAYVEDWSEETYYSTFAE